MNAKFSKRLVFRTTSSVPSDVNLLSALFLLALSGAAVTIAGPANGQSAASTNANAAPGSQRAEDARSISDTDEKSHGWQVGLGFWGASNPYESATEDEDSGVFPYLSYENDWLRVDPSELTIKAVRTQRFQVEALLAPRWVTSDPKNTLNHADLERETSLDIGLRASSTLGPAKASLEYRGDISGEIDGSELTAKLGAQTAVTRKFSIGAEGGLHWRDSKLATYLYGVRADEVLVAGQNGAVIDRPRYDFAEDQVGHKEGAFIPFVGLQAGYALTDKVQLVAFSGVEFFDEDIRNSPVISDDLATSSYLGLMYNF